MRAGLREEKKIKVLKYQSVKKRRRRGVSQDMTMSYLMNPAREMRYLFRTRSLISLRGSMRESIDQSKLCNSWIP
jgi:hypothetical protein